MDNPLILATANSVASLALSRGFGFEVEPSGYGANIRVRKGRDSGTASIDASGRLVALRTGDRAAIAEFFGDARRADHHIETPRVREIL